MTDDGCIVKHLLDGLQFVVRFGLVGRKADDDARVDMVTSERGQYALTHLHHRLHSVGDDVGERLVQRHWQYEFGIEQISIND